MNDKPAGNVEGNQARKDARKERLRSALRTNLKRRKRAQADRPAADPPQKSAGKEPSGS
jgi:hypothetical protein